MFNQYRDIQYKAYLKARQYFIDHHVQLIGLEKYVSDIVLKLIEANVDEIARDFNEASYLFPFWQNYPPDDRGRQPKGDQYPWIEVGEHTFSSKFPRLLAPLFQLRDTGLPTGSDLRLVLSNKDISSITDNFTNSCWLSLDVKSVGPRDDQEHVVMSHNQISGNGVWERNQDGIKNSAIKAKGLRTEHPFHCSASPVYILSDGTILPLIQLVVKPIYTMLSIGKSKGIGGQPLQRIVLISIPNGLLLDVQPKYIDMYPSLFFPGKDDKGKNPTKVRSRVSFELLRKIDPWRVRTVLLQSKS